MGIASRRRLAISTTALLMAGVMAVAADPFETVRELLGGKPERAAVEPPAAPAPQIDPGKVNCANLVYGDNHTSVCFSSGFLSEVNQQTHIRTNEQLVSARLESAELFRFPFAVMTGEGSFSLTAAQRANMRDYLQSGGFIVASAGCSSQPWRDSFVREIGSVFPEVSLQRLDFSHPIFHSVYDIAELKCKGSHRAHLEGLEIDGKIVLIFSADGLNDTAHAGGNCCCCGGNEIRNSRQMNVNMLAYTLTH